MTNCCSSAVSAAHGTSRRIFRPPRGLLQFGQLRPVVRLGPRLDGALLNRLGGVGHDEVDVELDDVPEPVAGRARAERVVEGEQPRLRILVRDAAWPALEALGELVDSGQWSDRSSALIGGRWTADCRLLTDFNRPGGAAALEIRRLDRIGEALPQILAAQLHAVDDHLEHLPVGKRGGLHIVERDRPAIDEQPAEALSLEHVDRRRDSRPERLCGPCGPCGP